MFVSQCLLRAACCLLFVVCCVLRVCFCLLFGRSAFVASSLVFGSLNVGCFVDCCFVFAAWCVLCVFSLRRFWCLLFAVCCLVFVVWSVVFGV